MKRNALLAKPPHHVHQLQRTNVFRNFVGRSPIPEDYQGVHTTTDEAIAAAYAIGTWSKDGSEDSDSYPVVLVLDVEGLTPEPDVDAMLQGALVLDGNLRREVQRELDRGTDTVEGMREAFDHIEWGDQGSGVGDPPALFIFDQVPREPISSMIDALERHDWDDEAILGLIRRFAEEGSNVIPGIVLSEIVLQQKYMVDFDLDRVVKILAFRPWYEEVMDIYWDMDDDALDAKVEHIEQSGWKMWTIEDVDNIDIGDTKVVYDSGRTVSDPEYHGTISTAVEQAFPGLIPAEPPFPVE